MQALLERAPIRTRASGQHPWYMVYSGCGNRNCGLADTSGSTAFWRAAYATDVEAMRLLVKYGADPNIPDHAPPKPGRAPAAAQGGGAGLRRLEEAADEWRFRSCRRSPTAAPGASALHAAAGVEYGEGFAGNAHRHAPDGWLAAVKYLVEDMGSRRQRPRQRRLHAAPPRRRARRQRDDPVSRQQGRRRDRHRPQRPDRRPTWPTARCSASRRSRRRWRCSRSWARRTTTAASPADGIARGSAFRGQGNRYEMVLAD